MPQMGLDISNRVTVKPTNAFWAHELELSHGAVVKANEMGTVDAFLPQAQCKVLASQSAEPSPVPGPAPFLKGLAMAAACFGVWVHFLHGKLGLGLWAAQCLLTARWTASCIMILVSSVVNAVGKHSVKPQQADLSRDISGLCSRGFGCSLHTYWVS